MRVYKVYLNRCKPTSKPHYVGSAYTKERGRVTPIFVYLRSSGAIDVRYLPEYEHKETLEKFSLTQDERADISREVRCEVLAQGGDDYLV